MKKQEMVDHIAKSADLTKEQASDSLNAILGGIQDALKNGESVAFVGFGTFSVTRRSERRGRNPKTGESMTISASNQAKFKPGKSLRDSIN